MTVHISALTYLGETIEKRNRRSENVDENPFGHRFQDIHIQRHESR